MCRFVVKELSFALGANIDLDTPSWSHSQVPSSTNKRTKHTNTEPAHIQNWVSGDIPTAVKGLEPVSLCITFLHCTLAYLLDFMSFTQSCTVLFLLPFIDWCSLGRCYSLLCVHAVGQTLYCIMLLRARQTALYQVNSLLCEDVVYPSVPGL